MGFRRLLGHLLRNEFMLRLLLTSAVVNALVCVAFAQPPTQDDDVLREAILPLVTAHAGEVAVTITHLNTNASFRYRSDQPMPTASLIKLPVMVTAYQSASRGELDLAKAIRLTDGDKVPGSGILTDHFSSGATLPLRDYIRLMMRDSDNTATNVVIDQLGIAATAELMDSLGLKNTKLHSKVYRGDTTIFPERSGLFGIGSTTADEMVELLTRLHKGQLADEANTELMMAHLRSCDDRNKLARYLPAGTKLAHKTGAIGNCRTDAGIIETATGPVAVCVLTNKNEDQSWGDSNKAELLCAKIGQIITERFGVDEGPQNIRRGSTGLLVESLQRTLNARLTPSPNLGVDGDFGPSTESAVVRFQRDQKLTPTGVLDEATWQALGTLIENDESTDDPASFNADAKKLPKQPASDDSDPPIVTCKAWIIIDGTTAKELSSFNASKRLPPASTTKIMTAYIVTQLIAKDPSVADEIVTFSQSADQTIGSSSGLRAGERVSVLELLYGLMLPSGNDAAVAFAEHFGDRLQQELPEKVDGPVKAFVAYMNQTAKTLGLESTQFRNPHGLPNAEHLTTVTDLVRLAFEAAKDPLYRQLVSTRQFACTAESEQGYRRNVIWKNTNQLLGIEGFDGAKTGTTTAAGACLVASGSKDGKKRMLVILGSSDTQARYADSRNLFRWSLQLD
jgi:serine-type D-Ala-D-Ala carboxypeptidase (penicillin-binding protein 5/6)